MSAMISEETVQTIQRGLSDWWSEETEYVYQRIERWAAFARGYNRLRSQRYSRGRLTMTINEESRESANLKISSSSSSSSSSKKSFQEENKKMSSSSSSSSSSSLNPRFENTNQRSERRIKKSKNDVKFINDKVKDNNRTELSPINCCGAGLINYQSNKYIDNNCLEYYRYDHSIYFKTIGDIRGDNNNHSINKIDYYEDNTKFENVNKNYCNNIRKSNINSVIDYDYDNDSNKNDKIINNDHDHDDSFNKYKSSLDFINNTEDKKSSSYYSREIIDNEKSNFDNDKNNICIIIDEEDKEKEEKEEEEKENKNFNDKIESNQKFLSNILKIKQQSPRIVSQPTISGDNNIIWPSVLLNYKKNVHPINSPHSYSINK